MVLDLVRGLVRYLKLHSSRLGASFDFRSIGEGLYSTSHRPSLFQELFKSSGLPFP